MIQSGLGIIRVGAECLRRQFGSPPVSRRAIATANDDLAGLADWATSAESSMMMTSLSGTANPPGEPRRLAKSTCRGKPCGSCLFRSLPGG